jgi:hypothetical protein
MAAPQPIGRRLATLRRRLLATFVPEFVWPKDFQLDGVPIPVRGSPYSFGVKRLLCSGEYEKPERQLVARILRPGMNVVEMGGSIGVLTAIIAARIQPGGSLVSVEAAEDLVAYSRTWLERRFPHVKIVQGYAFPVLRLPAGLTVHGFDNHGVSLGGQVAYSVSPDTAAAGAADGKTYDIVTLCDKNHVPSPDVLVADIEGAEAVLLVPGVQLPPSIRHVVIELHPGLYAGKTRDRDRMIRFFEEQGLPLVERAGESYLFSRGASETQA